jgi:hypothetical protein
VALPGLFQDTQGVVGPLSFAVELDSPSQPVILYLAGQEVGQRERRQGPEMGRKAQQGQDIHRERHRDKSIRNRREGPGRITVRDKVTHRENSEDGTKEHNPKSAQPTQARSEKTRHEDVEEVQRMPRGSGWGWR